MSLLHPHGLNGDSTINQLLFSQISAMTQNLSGIAFPFAVLGIAPFLSFNLTGGDEVLQLLDAAYNLSTYIF